MVTKYRHRRTSDPATGFPNPIEPGEIAVNTANRQIAVGDANAATIGAPLPLLGVRLFDARARYAINDLISYQGDVLCALVGVTPGPFNAAHWKNITDDIDLTPYLPKAGGTMTGPIVLAANAAAPLQAVPLQQVQSEIAAIPPPPPPLYVSDTAPVGAPDNAMWWESDTGILYLRYNDGDSTAWVQAVALPGGDLSGLAEKSYVDAQDALKVAKAGDTMTGSLTINRVNPALLLSKTSVTGTCDLLGLHNSTARWGLRLVNGENEVGSNLGSNFQIFNYNDAGTLLGVPFSISRATGSATFTNRLGVNLPVGGSLWEGVVINQQDPTLNAGIQFNVNSKSVGLYAIPNGDLLFRTDNTQAMYMSANGDLRLGMDRVGGARLYFGSGSKFLEYSTEKFYLNGGEINLTYDSGSWEGININQTRAGTNSGIGMTGNGHSAQIYSTSTGGMLFRVDGSTVGDFSGGNFVIVGNGFKPGGGDWANTSDARIKNVLGDYISGLDAVAALQPVRYSYKGNDTPTLPEKSSVPYENSAHAAVVGKEFIGLIAQAAEVPMPELVTMAEGYIDGQPVTDLRNLDTTPLIFALVNAVKELKARIETLETAAPAARKK